VSNLVRARAVVSTTSTIGSHSKFTSLYISDNQPKDLKGGKTNGKIDTTKFGSLLPLDRQSKGINSHQADDEEERVEKHFDWIVLGV
jgi:hypothetical protein